MQRIQLSPGTTRIRLSPEDTKGFQPIDFSDECGTFLTQIQFSCTPRPVRQLNPAGGKKNVLQTANGEVTVFEGEETILLRDSHSAQLSFSCPGGQILTGLGQHEDGIFDYANRKEYLYQHNMKIAVPFLLSSAGWGLLLEAGCAMKYEGTENGFIFTLDAVREVSYVVIRAKNCAEVLKTLLSLTGKPALLPKWTYGYIQSKERYKTARELTDTAREFRQRKLGLDCIVLDWCSWREGCWGDKTPDPERFPDVRALTDALHSMNVHFMVSIWPNMESGQDSEAFEKAGWFLPGSRIYDAFRPEARDLYWQQCRRCWMDGGTDALWCDSCEPITDPDWCGNEKRDAEERMRLLTEASALRMNPEEMNRYGDVHLRGLYEHWRRDDPSRRPVLLARSGGLGSGAAGVILWSGDTAASWDVLRKQVTEGIRTACSGICWWTLDIGAFFTDRKEPWFWRGDYPDGVADPAYRELYIRWFQYGAMLPVFRSHGTDTPREPWQFGAEDSPEYHCLREAIALRYRLLPYLYSAAAQSCREGLPMIRAMMIQFPDQPELAGIHDQYMLGDSLLVKPVTKALKDGGDTTEIVLPQGGWYDFFSRTCFEGGKTIRIPTPLDRFPVFVRAGSILPVAENAQCAADVPVPAREYLIFGGTDGSLLLYDDAGDGYGEALLISMCYWQDRRRLEIGNVRGSLKEPVTMTFRILDPDGSRQFREVRYDGEPAAAVFLQPEEDPEKRNQAQTDRVERFMIRIGIPELFAKQAADQARASLRGEKMGEHDEGAEILVRQLSDAIESRESGAWKRLPEEIWLETMRCYPRFISEHRRSYGRDGFDRGEWTVRQAGCRLFRIGELEYELLDQEGKRAVSMHIPSDTRLEAGLLNDSVRQARAFLGKYYPEWQEQPFVCESWLLSPALKELLPPETRIRRFQDAFDLIKVYPDDEAALEWVFYVAGGQRDSVKTEDLPENTSLQRKMKAMLLAGKKPGSARGILARSFREI